MSDSKLRDHDAIEYHIAKSEDETTMTISVVSEKPMTFDQFTLAYMDFAEQMAREGEAILEDAEDAGAYFN